MNRKQRRAAEKTSAADPVAQAFAQALAHHQAGAIAEAEAGYRRVLARRPDHPEAQFTLGLVLQTQGRLAEAVTHYQKVLVQRPGHVDSLANMSVALKELGQFEAAVAAGRRAVTLEPGVARHLSNLSAALLMQSKHAEAETLLRQALAIDPNHVWSVCNLVRALLQQDKLGEGMELARRAVALNPDFAVAQYNLAIALTGIGRIEEGIQALERTLVIEPGLADAHFLLAQQLLLLGQYARGFAEYEWRWRLKEYGWINDLPDVVAKPRWNGEELVDKTILVHFEQGLGDTLQFVRYVPMLAARARHVVLGIQPVLKPLLACIRGVTVVGLDERLPPFDVRCPLLSLPGVFGTLPHTVPAPLGYVTADPAGVERWRTRLHEGGLRVGIAWQGKPGVQVDRGRSIPLASFEPLARVPGVRLISLQKNVGIEQLSQLPAGMTVETLGADFDTRGGAFLDTSAVMMNLDLVITSDTAVAHLAGALGRPAWVALKAVPEWRWGLAGDRSPWYPTMRLFRQTEADNWTSVFAAMAHELAALVAAPSSLPA
jgi:tetratricopeptide (TPR) repeat protein